MSKNCSNPAGTGTDALQSHFPDIIAAMKSCFKFHDFVKSLAHKHQCEYIDALNEYKCGDTPFRDLHSELERRLHSNAERYRITLSKHKEQSTDIFGSSSYCGKWRKI